MMPFSPLRIWGAAFLSWALLAGGVYCLWKWNDLRRADARIQEVLAKRDGDLPGEPPEPRLPPEAERVRDIATVERRWPYLAAGLGLLSVTHSWFLLVPSLALLTTGQGLAIPNLAAAVADRAPDGQRGEALGFQQRWQSLGRIVGPIAAGALFQVVGVSAPYVAGAALTLLALGLLTRAQSSLAIASTA